MAISRHRSLVGRGGRKVFVRDKGLAQKKGEKCQHTEISNPKKRFEQMELSAKLPDYFLWSNKSNINQWA